MSTARRSLQWFIAIVIAGGLLLSPRLAAPAHAVGATLYVAPAPLGSDLFDCRTPIQPCPTINGAIAKASAGDTIKVAVGTYYYSGTGNEVVLVGKDITLSGGWDTMFLSQTGLSTIDGQSAYRGVKVPSSYPMPAPAIAIDRFLIQHSVNSGGWPGGGILAGGALTLTNSVIANNSSSGNGGGIMAYGPTTIDNSSVRSNSADGDGAGLDLGGTATISNTTISGNQIVGSHSGSAIDAGGTVYVNNSTISGNTGASALTVLVGRIMLKNTTVTGNSGGIDNTYGTVSLANSIVAGNIASGKPDNCYGLIGSQGYNLIGVKNSGCTFFATTGDLVGTTAAPLDPKLAPLQDNGGPAFTHALLPGSPAIDHGNGSVEPGSEGSACLATDQRGLPRPTLAQGKCDIGAYEQQLPAVLSINRLDPNPTGAGPVRFAVTFSSAVTGVNTTAPFSDFNLTTTGMTGAAITAVSGSGSSYVVSANTGTGIGTARLDLIDDDTIQDAISGKPLGGAGAGNGSFTLGQSYTIANPYVVSITRLNANPNSAAVVKFLVTFSQQVTGVNIGTASDFTLTKTGITGGGVVGIAGSGTAYTVSVKTGSGNGTTRLNLVDNDSITGPNGGLLGGTGAGNGNYSVGEIYTIRKIPILKAPTGTIGDTTPTFKWVKVPRATRYQYELYAGNTLIYSGYLAGLRCGTVCTVTPPTQIDPNYHRWRVRALIDGTWKPYSTFKTFALRAPQPGLWGGAGVGFYATPDRGQVDDFSAYIRVDPCGDLHLLWPSPVPIRNGGFKYSVPQVQYYGTFDRSAYDQRAASGRTTFASYPLWGCGLLSGYYDWVAFWQNPNQPAPALDMQPAGDIIILRIPDAPFGSIELPVQR